MPRAAWKEPAGNRQSVAVTEKANRGVEEFLKRHKGGKKQDVVAAILEFFADAPASMKLLMAGRAPEDLAEEFAEKARSYLITVANGRKPIVDVEHDAQAGQKALPAKERKVS